MTYLLETCGVDVNQGDSNNCTALHWACRENHVSSVGILLQHDADPNLSRKGRTPLMTCAAHGHLASISLLLQDGRCNLETKSHDTGATAILLAADRKKWDCVELLLSYHASPVATRNDGQSLHSLAMYHQAPPRTSQLIEAAIFAPDRARLLYRARRINEARPNPPTGPAFLQRRLPRVELTFPDAGYEAGQEKLRAAVQHVVGMKEDGSVGEGMLKEHVVELMDMLLPLWDAERERT
jgi:ankyrin repeat protein